MNSSLARRAGCRHPDGKRFEYPLASVSTPPFATIDGVVAAVTLQGVLADRIILVLPGKGCRIGIGPDIVSLKTSDRVAVAKQILEVSNETSAPASGMLAVLRRLAKKASLIHGCEHKAVAHGDL